VKMQEIEVQGHTFMAFFHRRKVVICAKVPIMVINPLDHTGTPGVVYQPFKQVVNTSSKYMPHQGERERNRRKKQLEKLNEK
jgi:hypothetical protein